MSGFYPAGKLEYSNNDRSVKVYLLIDGKYFFVGLISKSAFASFFHKQTSQAEICRFSQTGIQEPVSAFSTPKEDAPKEHMNIETEIDSPITPRLCHGTRLDATLNDYLAKKPKYCDECGRYQNFKCKLGYQVDSKSKACSQAISIPELTKRGL